MSNTSAVVLEDRHLMQAAQIIASTFGTTTERVAEWFILWWERNPHYQKNAPRGWVIEIDGMVAGFTSCIPLPYLVQERFTILHATGSMCVSKDFRGRGLARLLAQSFADHDIGTTKIGTGSTTVARKIWLDFGFNDLNFDWPNLCPQVPISFANRLNLYLQRRHLPRWVSMMASTPFRIVENIRLGHTELEHGIHITRRDAPFPESDNDQLTMMRLVDGRIQAFRDAETLNWLNFSIASCASSRIVFEARRDGSQLVGYAVFNKFSDCLHLLEYRVVQDNPEIIRAMFAVASDTCRSEGGVAILVWPYTEALKTAINKTVPSRHERMNYVVKGAGDLQGCNLSQWVPEPGDGDIALFW